MRLKDGFRCFRAGDADEQEKAADGEILELNAVPIDGIRMARRDKLRVIVQQRCGIGVPSGYVSDCDIVHYMFLATLISPL